MEEIRIIKAKLAAIEGRKAELQQRCPPQLNMQIAITGPIKTTQPFTPPYLQQNKHGNTRRNNQRGKKGDEESKDHLKPSKSEFEKKAERGRRAC